MFHYRPIHIKGTSKSSILYLNNSIIFSILNCGFVLYINYSVVAFYIVDARDARWYDGENEMVRCQDDENTMVLARGEPE